MLRWKRQGELRVSWAPWFKVLLLGDVRQTLYQFMEADGRYLSLADAVLCDSSPWPWVRLPLHTSRRCSGAITSFINRCMLGANVMKLPPSTPPGPPVEYVVGHGGHCASYVAEKVCIGLRVSRVSARCAWIAFGAGRRMR
jgi:hypothetical protein